MPNYINKHEFHAEMVKCKKEDKLSNRAIGFFQLMAKEISKTYYYYQPEDRDDAIARAIMDCYRYWRGFKEANVVQIPFANNFSEHDKIIVSIVGYKTITFTASQEPKRENEFLICDTINRSLKSMILCMNENVGCKPVMAGYLDTIKKKLTIMDKFNRDDLNIKSNVVIMQNINGKMDVKEIPFKNPPDAFCYYTSTVRNGILKVFNELYPDVHKPANRMSMSSLNDHQQGMYNI